MYLYDSLPLSLLQPSRWLSLLQEEVWGQAIQDLTEAANLLPLKNEVVGKPTKGAALATLGKIYLLSRRNTIKPLMCWSR